MIDNWGREISQNLYLYTTYMKSIIGTGRLIIWLIIIAFRIDLAATFLTLYSSKKTSVSMS